MHTWRLADAKSSSGQYASSFEACVYGITRQEACPKMNILCSIQQRPKVNYLTSCTLKDENDSIKIIQSGNLIFKLSVIG